MKFIPNSVTRVVASKSHLLGQHSPRILFVVGTVGMIGATVLACKATLKLEGVMDHAEAEMADLNQIATRDPEAFSLKEFKSAKTHIYINSARDLTKLYAPALCLGVVSIACLTKSHSILSKRNASLTLAYATLEKAFDEYRDRVKNKYGDDAEFEIYHDVSSETKTVDGKKKVVKKVNNPGLYARFYDEFAKNWQPDPEANRIFIMNQQNWANDRLESRGHLFLNEVYDMLGLDRTEIGQYVGWTLDANPEEFDTFVDFGIYDSPRARNFVNGHEPSVLLDFNVHGRITDKI